jgi:predicted RNA polymerase sigma factor
VRGRRVGWLESGPASPRPPTGRAEAALSEYHLLWSVRGDLLTKLGRTNEARVELLRAARLARNPRERALLCARAEACTSPAS